jgi:hypothetical protein
VKGCALFGAVMVMLVASPVVSADPYPLDLEIAIQKSYAPTPITVQQTCEVWAGTPSRSPPSRS